MYNEFCITDIDLLLANKSIIIKANLKIDESTVNLNTVKLKDAKSGAMEDYSLSVSGSKIILEFRDWPKQNHEYLISVSTDLKDRLERNLNASLNKTVMFKEQVKHKVNIISPNVSETIKGNELIVRINTTPVDNTPKDYLYEIALDNAFCEIIHSYQTDKEEALFLFKEDNQYFVRVRMQDRFKPNLIGGWSEVVDCIIVDTNNNCNEECKCDSDELSPFLEDMLSMDTILMDVMPLEIVNIQPNGVTGDTMFIYFNQDIDENSLPEALKLIRRDL